MTSVQRWMGFFLDAGIPDVTAATYATNFANNRIEMSMLMDLNKDYLKDLEINLLGDVILVLRHAKKVAERHASEKVLGDKVSTKAVTRDPGSTEKKATKREAPTEKSTSPPPKKSYSNQPPPKKKVQVDEPPPKKIIKAKFEMVDPKMESLSARLGPKIKQDDEMSSKSSVFGRLGEQEKSIKIEADAKYNIFRRLEPVKKELKIEDSSAPVVSGNRLRLVLSNKPEIFAKAEREEKTSAFDRLDKPDSTQECRVSSSNELTEPSRGILKQRGVKGGLVRSQSASSIISLKPQENVKKKVRVSFGENDVRCVSPRAGIKARLGLLEAAQDHGEDLEVVNVLPRPASSPALDLRRSIAGRPGQETARSADPGSIPKVKKKFYLVKTLSDGTKEKVEVSPNDPLLRKIVENKSSAAAAAKLVNSVRDCLPPAKINPIGITRRIKQDAPQRGALTRTTEVPQRGALTRTTEAPQRGALTRTTEAPQRGALTRTTEAPQRVSLTRTAEAPQRVALTRTTEAPQQRAIVNTKLDRSRLSLKDDPGVWSSRPERRTDDLLSRYKEAEEELRHNRQLMQDVEFQMRSEDHCETLASRASKLQIGQVRGRDEEDRFLVTVPPDEVLRSRSSLDRREGGLRAFPESGDYLYSEFRDRSPTRIRKSLDAFRADELEVMEQRVAMKEEELYRLQRLARQSGPRRVERYDVDSGVRVGSGREDVSSRDRKEYLEPHNDLNDWSTAAEEPGGAARLGRTQRGDAVIDRAETRGTMRADRYSPPVVERLAVAPRRTEARMDSLNRPSEATVNDGHSSIRSRLGPRM